MAADAVGLVAAGIIVVVVVCLACRYYQGQVTIEETTTLDDFQRRLCGCDDPPERRM